MISLNVFSILLLLSSIFYQSINADSINTTPLLDVNDHITTTLDDQTTSFSNTTTTTTTVNTTIVSQTTKSSEAITTSTAAINTTIVIELSTSDVQSDAPVQPLPKRSWWLLAALLITIVVVIGIGIIYYHRQQTPYRRFLRNWRSRDDEADNIILQLEQPDIMHSQWPPRISFA